MRGPKKSLPGRPQKFFFINLIELSPIFYCLNGKKRKFVQINLLVEIFLFVCAFLKQKIYILIHIRLMRAGR